MKFAKGKGVLKQQGEGSREGVVGCKRSGVIEGGRDSDLWVQTVARPSSGE
jgi:hypothetical protein